MKRYIIVAVVIAISLFSALVARANTATIYVDKVQHWTLQATSISNRLEDKPFDPALLDDVTALRSDVDSTVPPAVYKPFHQHWQSAMMALYFATIALQNHDMQSVTEYMRIANMAVDNANQTLP